MPLHIKFATGEIDQSRCVSYFSTDLQGEKLWQRDPAIYYSLNMN